MPGWTGQENMERAGCSDSIEEARQRMMDECTECCQEINEEDLEMCFLGLDVVVGLFTVMKSRNMLWYLFCYKLPQPSTRGGHCNKMAYDEFYSIFWLVVKCV